MTAILKASERLLSVAGRMAELLAELDVSRMDTEGNEVDRREWPPSEVPEELLARTHIRDALLQITNGRRLTRLKDHNFHSGIYLNQGD